MNYNIPRNGRKRLGIVRYCNVSLYRYSLVCSSIFRLYGLYNYLVKFYVSLCGLVNVFRCIAAQRIGEGKGSKTSYLAVYQVCIFIGYNGYPATPLNSMRRLQTSKLITLHGIYNKIFSVQARRG